ncbi:MAG: transketolase [Myxococcales bacterium]|nr:transketolase [Myxococcales bacterium]MCB9717234.1 transketolase [Myxococcales bacterium]
MSARAALPPRAHDPALHELLVKTIKGLTMDAVQKANSGHPGMPMGTADMASTLWSGFLVHDPAQPRWPDRDRFVLSAGHGSMLLYSLLHLHGYDLPMEQLQQFRQLGSRTPGHPEVDHTPGVEVTTGPLGSGFAAGVGLALGERLLAARYNRPGHEIVDHLTYGIVSDGDLMEGIASEAASLAGHLGLGKLVYLYDANRITIDGSTDVSFTEDVAARFTAYGWHVAEVDGHDPEAIAAALEVARAELSAPSLIVCRTTIGQGAPTKAGKSSSHGSPLGAAEVEGAKRAMGWPLEPTFYVPDELRAGLEARRGALTELRQDWDRRFAAYEAEHPELAAQLRAAWADELPEVAMAALDALRFEAGTAVATRKVGAKVLAALVEPLPSLVGGSADLAGSNGVDIPALGWQSREQPGGRGIHFGVREHGMAGVCNGLALHGGLRPFDATFLIFSDFMRGALRLSALMRLPVVHVLSHDSIFLGEDGPTHQPIEQCMSLRLVPHLHVVRPADANETVGAWIHALQRKRGDGPTAILVSRQDLPVLEHGRRDVSRGAYVLWEPAKVAVADLHAIVIATGSEVSLALEAAHRLHEVGLPLRVVSMPCWEAFEAQDQAYRDEVLPPSITRRISVEAGVTVGWGRWASHHVGIDDFGASAPAEVLAEHFGLTPEALIERIRALP